MLLQKKDNEGFGFVLRGAKGELRLQKFSLYRFHSLVCSFSPFLISLSLPHFKPRFLLSVSIHAHPFFVLSFAAQTPIEEFTPTPAFPALQYLESVDEGGVAWRAGLRMGDFLIEVWTSCNSDKHTD